MKNKFNTIKTINCPQCGDSLPLYFKQTKLVQCSSCESSIFLEDDSTHLAGKSSVLANEPSLIKLHETFSYSQKTYFPIGKIRYSYGRGFWEEWWIKDTKGNEYWLSIDEGDLVLQQKVKVLYSRKDFENFYIGKALNHGWMVTELGHATCVGFTGSLPHKVSKGDNYKYAHLSGKSNTLQTIEVTKDGIEVYMGQWISPFDISKVF